MSVAYTVSDSNGNVVAQDVRPLDEAGMAFLPAEGSGELKIEAQILGANGQPVTVSTSTLFAGTSTAGDKPAAAQRSRNRSKGERSHRHHRPDRQCA